MTNRRKGFTLVEVIVVLVILAILAAIMIPSMTGWIDKAKEKQLVVACRTCVNAAQTLASEAYGVNGKSTPPDGGAVIALAGVNGTASNISLDNASAAVNTLTYSDGTEAMTYTRLPTPKYEIGTGLAGPMSEAWDWAQSYTPKDANEANEQLTIRYGGPSSKNPTLHTPLTDDQLKSIFGDRKIADVPYYIYPMAIYTKDGKLLNIQYVTRQNPVLTRNQNRYVANAFIIEGETYIAKRNDDDGNVKGEVASNGTYFQRIMNMQTFESEQEFATYITNAKGAYMKK